MDGISKIHKSNQNPLCPKEVNGLPVVCTWEEKWQEKMGEYIKKKQDFILLGPKEYIENIKKKYESRDYEGYAALFLLGGYGALGFPGLSATSLSTTLGLSAFATADPEPTSKTILIALVAGIVGLAVAYLIWEVICLFKDKVKLKEVKVGCWKGNDDDDSGFGLQFGFD